MTTDDVIRIFHSPPPFHVLLLLWKKNSCLQSHSILVSMLYQPSSIVNVLYCNIAYLHLCRRHDRLIIALELQSWNGYGSNSAKAPSQFVVPIYGTVFLQQSATLSHPAFRRALKSHLFYCAVIAYLLALYIVDCCEGMHSNAQSASYCITGHYKTFYAMLKHVLAIGCPSVRLSVCLSVRPSVTRWYCIKTAEHIAFFTTR